MAKRYRRIEAKPRQLVAAYGRDDVGNLDLQYAWGGDGAQSPDARVLSNAIEGVSVFDGKCLRDVLADRGYDLSTLRFSVSLLPQEPHNG